MSDDKDADFSHADDAKAVTDAAIAGYLLRGWLPFGFVRKAIMLCIFIGGLYGLFTDHPHAVFLWLLLPLFSPRAMGELAYLLGRISGSFRR